MKKISFTFLAFMAFFLATAQHRATFDDLPLAPDSFWNGSNLSGGFLDGDAFFNNNYDTASGGYWSGFAYSNVPVNTDTINTGAYDDYYQYSSAEGGGAFGSSAFGICYIGDAYESIALKGFATGNPVYGFYVTNSAYDYLSMKYGDTYAKKFGGPTGTDPDWFLLTISGWYQGAALSNSVQFYLADFRNPDTTQHYILNTWKFVDLLPLGNVDSLSFVLTSSDTGVYGMNTPAYFDMDNFMTSDGVPYSPPIAVNDSFEFQYIDTITGTPDTLVANILANDTINAVFDYTVAIVKYPDIVGAMAYLDSNNNLVYIPAAGVQGEDTVDYEICDGFDSCSVAQVLILVLGPNNTQTGIADIPITEFYIYPNPATSRISISSNQLIQSVSVIDISGREALQEDINRNATTLDVSSLGPGIYSVLIHTSEGVAARRLVKE